MKKRNEQVVAEVSIAGRAYTITLTEWVGTDGLSFDVHDKATGLCLTPESLDNQPGLDEVDDLLEELADDLECGTLDPFFQGQEGELAEALRTDGSTPDTEDSWTCEGCGMWYAESDADMIADHVSDCDLVDGAGHGY